MLGDTDRPRPLPRLTVGLEDPVAHSGRFMQNTSQFTGVLPKAEGKIVDLTQVGEILLARVEWDCRNLPDRVNARDHSPVIGGVVIKLE